MILRSFSSSIVGRKLSYTDIISDIQYSHQVEPREKLSRFSTGCISTCT